MALGKTHLTEWDDEKQLYWRISMVRITSPRALAPTDVTFDLDGYPSREWSAEGKPVVDHKRIKMLDLKAFNRDLYEAVKTAFYGLCMFDEFFQDAEVIIDPSSSSSSCSVSSSSSSSYSSSSSSSSVSSSPSSSASSSSSVSSSPSSSASSSSSSSTTI